MVYEWPPETVEEVKHLKKAIAGLKRNEEIVKEIREMEPKILLLKNTLETGSAAYQRSSRGDAQLSKTDEKMAMRQTKMIKI